MALDVGKELGGVEARADQIAFQLGHVDAVGGETAQRLEKGGGHVAHAEDEGGDQQPRLRVRHDGIGGHDQEARGVVFGILDIGLERDQPVQFPGQFGSDGGLGLVAVGGDLGGGAGGIHMHHRLDAHFLDHVAALVQGMDVAVYMGDVRNLGAGQAQQVVVHPLEVFADDVQAGIRQQVMNVGNPPGHGIFNGDHGQRRLTVADGGEGVLKGPAGQGLHLRAHAAAGQVGIGSGHALEGDGFAGVGHGGLGSRRSGAAEYLAGAVKVGGSIDAQRHRVNAGSVDAQAVFQGP